jgi:hypothetical protein
MTREKAEQSRQRAITAVQDAQAALGRATSNSERAWLKKELDDRLVELAAAKAKLREINLSLSSAKPIEPPALVAPLSTEELAARLVESFDQLLLRNPSHPAIRALRAHFEAERPRPPVPPQTRLPSPRPLRQRGKIPFLDANGRQSGGPGSVLYRDSKVVGENN